MMMLLIVSACDKTSVKSEKLVFNTNPAKLANVPAGYGMSEAVFSTEGRHVAITTIKDGKAVVFFGSEMSKPYENVRDLVFRSDYGDYAFVAGKDGKESVVVNGESGKSYDGIGKPFFAPDGRLIYEARANDHWIIVAGKHKSAPFDSSNPRPVMVSDGKRLAFTELHRDTKKNNLRVCSLDLKDCVRGKSYDSVSEFTSDSSRSHLAYVVGKDGKKTVVTVDFGQPNIVEKEGRWYDEVSIVSFSDRGDHLAYLAKTENKTILVKDGLEVPIDKYDTVFEMAMSNNGRTLYSTMVKGKVAAFIDGKKTGKDYNGVNTLSFSPDGINYVFTAGKGDKSVVVINGQETQVFDKAVTPKFSPDGSKIVYRARNNGERFVVVADLKGRTIREHPHYEAVWDVTFSPDGKFVGYGIKTGQEFWWKAEEL